MRVGPRASRLLARSDDMTTTLSPSTTLPGPRNFSGPITRTSLPTCAAPNRSRNMRNVLGNDTGISSASISAIRRIVIGQGVLVGSGCIITDTDHHYVEVPEGIRRRYAGIPEGRHDDEVFISDDVFLGARTIVLKGVRIGQGAVIGAGSVVSRDVPEYVLAAGNPCRIVGRVE